MIDRHFSPDSVKRMNFFKALIQAIKSRSFVVWFLFGISNGVYVSLVVTNMLYLTTFVLNVGGFWFLVILGFNLVGNLIGIPIWLRYIRKTNNNKKAFVVAGLISCAALFPLTFFMGLIDLIIMAFILGLAQGGLNSYIYTIVSPSVTEDVIVKMGRNQKGVLLGISAMLLRFVAFIDEFIIAAVHDLTGFVPGKKTYLEMAAVADMNLVGLGIRLLQGVIPGVVLLIGVLVFWKFFPITQERLLSNKAKMQELGF